MKSTRFSVGEVAAQFDLPTNVLRHWESVGLLDPERDAGGRRRYDEDDVVRVAVIQRSKLAGMSLDQIRVLLDSEARGRHEVLEAHVAELDRRMEEMRLSRAMTMHAFECKEHDVTSCPSFRRWVDDLLGGFAS
jgi:MerR family transcriptional regulator, copper efflux regulator